MKKLPILLSAAALLLGSAAFAQDIDSPMYGEPTAKQANSLTKVMNLYIAINNDRSVPGLNEAISKEMDRSTNIDVVNSPIEAATLVVPTNVTLPKEGKTEMKVGFQFSFWRGSEQDYTVSCAVSKPQDCAKAIRTRVDRLIRDSE